MILLIDNYDSFSYNLYQLVGALCPDVHVIRNDEMTLREIENIHPARIILSPGPGRPEDAGVTMEAVGLGERGIPVLGVCLGHQAICAHYGATVTYAARLMHGKQSEVSLAPGARLFKGCGEKTLVARYHSLAADPATVPPCLRVTAMTAAGEIMAVEHRELPIFGVQFHPESIMTPEGGRMLENFLKV